MLKEEFMRAAGLTSFIRATQQFPKGPARTSPDDVDALRWTPQYQLYFIRSLPGEGEPRVMGYGGAFGGGIAPLEAEHFALADTGRFLKWFEENGGSHERWVQAEAKVDGVLTPRGMESDKSRERYLREKALARRWKQFLGEGLYDTLRADVRFELSRREEFLELRRKAATPKRGEERVV